MMKITVGCSDTPSTIQRKEVNNSAKQLGVMANPASDFSQELERRKDYSTRMATRIRTLRMKPKDECLSIMKLFVRTILPNLGFNCHSP
eukprot:3554663-Ditylum_brightwellii.AAC.1